MRKQKRHENVTKKSSPSQYQKGLKVSYPTPAVAIEPKHAGGPTKYNPTYCQKIIEFFSVKHTEIREGVNAVGLPIKVEKENMVPFFSAFARLIGVSEETLSEWRRVHPEFSESYKVAKGLQMEMLVSNTMRGFYSQASAIFAMKNMIGWRDQIDHSHTLSPEEAARQEAQRSAQVEEVRGYLNGVVRQLTELSAQTKLKAIEVTPE